LDRGFDKKAKKNPELASGALLHFLQKKVTS
jgi:hypothetical protein